MLDGAGASTFLDLIDERNQQFVKTKPNNTDNSTENTKSDKEIPFTNVSTEKVRNDKKNIVLLIVPLKIMKQLQVLLRKILSFI